MHTHKDNTSVANIARHRKGESAWTTLIRTGKSFAKYPWACHCAIFAFANGLRSQVCEAISACTEGHHHAKHRYYTMATSLWHPVQSILCMRIDNLTLLYSDIHKLTALIWTRPRPPTNKQAL